MTPTLEFINEVQAALEAAHLPNSTVDIANTSSGLMTASVHFRIEKIECDIKMMWRIPPCNERIKYVLPRRYRTLRPLNITFRLEHDWPMMHIHTTVIQLEEKLKAVSPDPPFGFNIESGVSAHDAQAITIQHVEYIRETDVYTHSEQHRSRIVKMVLENILYIAGIVSEWFEKELIPTSTYT